MAKRPQPRSGKKQSSQSQGRRGGRDYETKGDSAPGESGAYDPADGDDGAALAPREVLAFFRSAGRPLTVLDLLRGLRLHKKRKEQARQVLAALAEEGRLVQIGHGWGLPDQMRMVTGRLEVQRSGVGFVIPDDPRRRDIFINPKDFCGAWHNDKVAVVLTSEGSPRRKPEGRIARIVKRGAERLPVIIIRRLGSGMYACAPTDPKLPVSLLVEADAGETHGPLAVGDVLVVEPGERIDPNVHKARLVEVLGNEADPRVQEQLVKVSMSIPTSFPQAAQDEAAALPTEPAEADFAGRRDLRAQPFVTIDGATARDFDDAICVRRSGRGHVLQVAIADVAHYVAPGSALDAEAQDRGNSYYFPQSVEPMFPERLSNGLCSLNPRVPRLVMVAEVEFDSSGEPVREAFYPGVIVSCARLVYENVALALADPLPPEGLEQRAQIEANDARVLPMLETARELARTLQRQRRERGSIDFDLPEPEILFDAGGQAMDVRPRERTFAHQLIEEFMIAANEAVARFLTEREARLLYRVHPAPDPDKIRTLYELLAGTELAPKVPVDTTPKALQGLLRAAEGTRLSFVVNRLTLRTMMQAAYGPDNDGHFGLASECYCHFTSPIRRYADLVVHRALKAELGMAQGQAYGYKRLQELGQLLSRRERVAMEAEREIRKRITVLVLRERVDEEFGGVVSALLDFGFFVELTEVLAEGLVRLSTLGDDYYTFLPDRHMYLGRRSGRIIRLGQVVRVRLTDVSLARLEVNLELAGEAQYGSDVLRPDDPALAPPEYEIRAEPGAYTRVARPDRPSRKGAEGRSSPREGRAKASRGSQSKGAATKGRKGKTGKRR